MRSFAGAGGLIFCLWASGAVATTWDTSYSCSGSTTFSNSNLTASNSTTGGNNCSSIATLGVSSGKWCAEMTWTNTKTGANDGEVGISITGISQSNYFLGLNTQSLGLAPASGNVFYSGGVLTTIQSATSGAVVDVCVDTANSHIWFRTNGGNWNNDIIANQNPATNTGGISTGAVATGTWYFAEMVGGGTAGTDTVTANFGGATPFTYPAPAGFGAFDSILTGARNLLLFGTSN